MSPRLPTRLLAAQSDGRLVELIAAGHERAFEVLVRRYRGQLLRYCARIGLSEQLAEDVVQHTLLQAWTALGRGTAVRELRPWLYRIAHNAAVNAVRGTREQPLAPTADGERDGAGASLEQDLARGMAVRETLSDVAALPQMQREAIVLSAIDGRSHEEVARVLGVSDGAVRGLLYRARAALRAAAAALTPAPLLGWASGAITRAAPTTARLAELSAGAANGDAGATLLKGVAVAATAALAAGAVLVPLRAHRAGVRHAATGRVAKLGASSVPGGDSSAVRLRAPAATPARSAARASAGSSRPREAGGVGKSERRRAAAAPAVGVLAPTRARRQLAVVRPQAPQSGGSGSGAGRGEGAKGEAAGASSTPPTPSPAPASAGSGVSEAPAPPPTPPPTPPPPTTGGAPETHEDPSEKAEQEAEAAREQKEREAEQAREGREGEEEAARELREREAERAGK